MTGPARVLSARPSLLSVDVDVDTGAVLAGGDVAPSTVAVAGAPAGTALTGAACLCTAVAGFPCLSLPYATAQLGWPGLVAIAAAGALTALLACHLVAELVECPPGVRHATYASLTQAHLGGSAASRVTRTLQAVACVGTCIATVIIGGTILKSLAALAVTPPPLPLAGWIAVFGVMLTLASFLPSLESSWTLAAAGGASFVVFGSISIALSALDGARAPPRSYAPPGASAAARLAAALTCIGTAVFVVAIGLAPEIAATLKPPVAKRMHASTSLAFSVIMPLFLVLAGVGYWAYGARVDVVLLTSNAKGGAPKPVLAVAWAALLVVTLAQALVYAFPVFQSAHHLARHRLAALPSDRAARAAGYAGRAAFVAAITLAAAALPFFGDVANAIGGVFLLQDWPLPLVFYARSRTRKRPPPARAAAALALAAALTLLGGLVVGQALVSLAHSADTYKLFANI